MEQRVYKYSGTIELECGETISNLEICYHISKDALPNKKVIWITHALTANSNPMDWWSVLVGEGKIFNPREYTIVCANILGSCYGTTSPISINPKNNKPYLLDFPKITVRDVVKCHNLLLNYLNIKQIDLIIGGSVGGFQALEWSIMNPDIIKGMVLIACNSRFTPWGSALNESQRMALFADKTFQEQEYIVSNNVVTTLGGAKGLAAARSIALISYRSYSGYNLTQQEDEEDTIFPTKALSYQQYQGKKLVDRFNPYSYLTMINITDSHNIGRGRGGVIKALKSVKANTLCIGIDSDILFPYKEQEFMAEYIENGEFELISSKFGHDGFLLEWQQIAQAIYNSKYFKFINRK